MATVQKTRKPKTNSFTSILDQVLNKYNLLAESNLLQLRAHTNELSTMLPDWKACKDVKKAHRWHLFKENQIGALVPNNKKKKLTIKKRAQYCAKTKDMWDIWLHALDLAVPKNNTDEAIVAASSRVLQFRKELAEAGRQLKQRLPNLPKTPKHFFLEEGLRRIQNINTTKIPTMQDLADVIIILSMRPVEVDTLRIIYYEPGESNPPKWYIKNKEEAKNNPEPQQFLSMEKNPECAKELLTWIQDSITTRKLYNPVYSINGKCNTGVFSKFLKSYSITAKRFRKIEGKHVSRVHDGQNPTSQHLEFLSRVAIRHKMDRHNSEIYYAEGDTSDSDLDADPEPEPETLASKLKVINENTSEIENIYDLYGSHASSVEHYGVINDKPVIPLDDSESDPDVLKSDHRLEGIVGDDLIGEEIKGLDLQFRIKRKWQSLAKISFEHSPKTHVCHAKIVIDGMSIPLFEEDFNKVSSTKNNLSKSTESKPGLAQEKVMNVINKILLNIGDRPKGSLLCNIPSTHLLSRRLNDNVSKNKSKKNNVKYSTDASSNSDTSDNNSSNSSTSSSEIEVTHAHKTRAVKKCPIRKRKVRGKVNYRA
ncbi:23043_t:CDS:2 [Cetraspora pellucida]|uniref:23043_t:CDS:1 n=1 Tax=Cetraspora pellucida TaxID=1433469 RepID=A0A9N9DI58_9GLOM|nr:23043_t:CDS:2 [Cetraspora pellucida]